MAHMSPKTFAKVPDKMEGKHLSFYSLDLLCFVGFFYFLLPLLKRKWRRPNKARLMRLFEWDLWGFCDFYSLLTNIFCLPQAPRRTRASLRKCVSVLLCQGDTASAKFTPPEECWSLTRTEMSPNSPDALIKTASLTLISPQHLFWKAVTDVSRMWDNLK